MEIAHVHISGVKAELTQRKGEQWEIPVGIIGGTIRLTFDAAWKGLSKTVVFQGCNQVKDVVCVGDLVTIPQEVVSRAGQKLRVGIYGVDTDGTTATPTLWVEGYIRPAAAPSGDASVDPTLPVWAQMEARLSDLERQYGIDIDPTLTEAGCAADAKEVGDRFAALVPLGYLEIDETLTKTGQAADSKAVGDALEGKLSLSGGTMTGPIHMDGSKVTGLGDPTDFADAVNLGYANASYAPAKESEEHSGCYWRSVGGVTEWLNPPVISGIEYCTTERYMGNRVYTKLVDCGAAANGKEIVHGITAKRLIRYTGTVSNVPFPVNANANYNGYMSVTSTKIYIFETGYDDLNAYVQIWYTKD